MGVSKAGTETSLHRIEKYSWRLILTIAGTVLGTIVPSLFKAGPINTLIGAIVAGLLIAFFTTEGPPTRTKAVAALLLTLIAAILTVSGITLFENVRGKSISGDRKFTFPVVPAADQSILPADTSSPELNSTPNTNQTPRPNQVPSPHRVPNPNQVPNPPQVSKPKPVPHPPTVPDSDPAQNTNPAPNTNLSAPTHVSPNDGAVLTKLGETTLIWKSVRGAAQYFVEVECLSCSVSGEWSPQANTTTAAISHRFTWVGNNDGRWRVTAIAEDGTRGAASGWWHFTYRTAPPTTLPAPTHVSPDDGAVLTNQGETTITWKSVPGAARYVVEVECRNCSAGSEWSPQANTTTDATSHNFTWVGSNDGRWRVTAIAEDGTRGATSEWWHFTYRT